MIARARFPAFVLAALALLAVARAGADDVTEPPLVILGDIVHTMTGPPIEKGAVVINVPLGVDAKTVAFIDKAVESGIKKATGGRPVNKNVKVRG